MAAGRVAVVCAVALAGGTSVAHAGAFLIRDQTAAGFGTALAGVAAGDVLSYSFWNPAVLATQHGLQFEAVATGILPSIEVNPDYPPGSTVDIGKDALVPAGFVSYALTDALTVGLAVTSPFGLSTEAPRGWAGQYHSLFSELRSYNVTPMAAIRVNDMISIGGGVQFEYFSAELTQATLATDGKLDASDDLAIGFNLGIQLTPWDGTTIGLGYRSSISHDLEGTLYSPYGNINAGATLDTPDIVSLGIKQDVTDAFRLLGTVEWANWSRLGEVPVVTPTGVEVSSLPLNYRDGWLFSFGVEYDATEALTLRAGIGYEIAPLTTANRDTRFPETDQFILSAGLSYAFNDVVTLDFAYLYSMGLGDGDIRIDPTTTVPIPFIGTSDLDISIVSVGLRVKFDSATPQPAAFPTK